MTIWRSPTPAAFLLEGLDYRVKIWNDSQNFIDQVDPYQCGVVMLDIRMPGIDGQQIHQRLRERESTLAVVIVTGHGDIAMAVAEMKLGRWISCKSRLLPHR
ncbi:Transcriptional regulatory protein fixJ [Serratia fonticola]|uniref:Transcriptional regulatory protein fixJ n=1 Tax=Serratia fonticola TaxID=47917 RepID=A0A4V6KMW7_SERFO|nr:Transcriptional regulatory protein fixJ [Serratia fonticola]